VTHATELYRVLVNDEGQYSIWPSDRELPPGWRDGGKTGSKQECLAFVEKVWRDLRPRSVRERLDAP
jgi:MbtH protein